MPNLGDFHGFNIELQNTLSLFQGFEVEEVANVQFLVVDSVTGDPLEGVFVRLDNEVYVTNNLGYTARLNIIAGTYQIEVDGAPVNYTSVNLTEDVAAAPTFELITVQLTELIFSGIAIKFDTAPIRPPVGVVAPVDVLFCPCDFRCDFEEKVFADPDNDGIKNDFSDFLFQKITASDSIIIELVKGDIIVAQINDDTYGLYYNGFPSNSMYVGWQADWTKIFNAFSGGRYQVKVTTTILGVTTEFFSRYFRLNTFDILSADKTIKIESFQNGNILNSEFNFTGLVDGGWRSSIRLDGTFGAMQPAIERDIYQDTSYREIQNRDTVNREYRLDANLVPESIYDRITTKDLLGNRILITSYNVLQELKYKKLPVVPESFDEARYDKLGNTHFGITFSDRQKNIIKTNV